MSNNFYNDNNIDNSVPFNSLPGQIAETKNNNIFKVTCESTYATTVFKSNATGGGMYFSGQYVPIKITSYEDEAFDLHFFVNGKEIDYAPFIIDIHSENENYISYYLFLVTEDMDIEIKFIAL